MTLGRHVFPICSGVTRLRRGLKASADAREDDQIGGRGSKLRFLCFSLCSAPTIGMKAFACGWKDLTKIW